MGRPVTPARTGIVSSMVWLFSLTACVMLAAIVYSLVSPYEPVSRRGAQEAAAAVLPDRPSTDIPAYRTEIFRQKRLFDCNDSGRGRARTSGERGPSLALVGISFGERKLAVIRDTAERKEYYLTEGESAGGFEVVSIEREKVVLRSGEKTMELVK